MSKVTSATEVRLSYTNLLEPRAQDAAKPDEVTYSTAILIPKTDTVLVDAIQAAVKEELANGKTKKWGGKLPTNLRNPLRDGDAERPDDEVYAGHWFINAKGPFAGRDKPVLLDSKGQETDSAGIVYSGVYGRVVLTFYPYANSGNNGVACGIASFLSGEHGDDLSGSVVTAAAARNEFGVTAPVTPASEAAAEFAGKSDESATATAPADAADIPDDPWAS